MHKKSPCSPCLRCKLKKTSWCKLSSYLLLFNVGIKINNYITPSPVNKHHLFFNAAIKKTLFYTLFK